MGRQWTLTGGTLPAGIALTAQNACVLTASGTPIEFGAFALSLGVTDAHGGVASVNLSLVVDPVAVQIITTAAVAGVLNEAYKTTIDTSERRGVGYVWAPSPRSRCRMVPTAYRTPPR